MLKPEKTLVDRVGDFITGMHKNAKRVNDILTEQQVEIEYQRQSNYFDKTFGEKLMKGLRPMLFYIIFIISYVFIFYITMFYSAPMFQSINSNNIAIVLKVITVLLFILSTNYLYPLLILGFGPYYIYNAFNIALNLGIYKMATNIFNYKTINISGKELFSTNHNVMLKILIFFLIGLILIKSYNYTHTFMSKYFPNLIKVKEGKYYDIPKNEMVGISYYEKNKDKDIVL